MAPNPLLHNTMGYYNSYISPTPWRQHDEYKHKCTVCPSAYTRASDLKASDPLPALSVSRSRNPVGLAILTSP